MKENLNMVLANENDFNVEQLSTPLTAFAAGYKDPEGIDALLEIICPQVPTAMRFQFQKFGEGQFAAEDDDIRASGADFKNVTYGGDTVDSSLFNKGLSVTVDEKDYYEGWETRTVAAIKRRLWRNELNRFSKLLIVAAGTLTAKKWMASGTGRSNPDADLSELVDSVGDASGLDANIVLIGSTAWRYRYASLVGSTAVGEGGTAKTTPSELADWLGVNKVLISKLRAEITTAEGKKKVKILDTLKVFAYNAVSGLSKDDPSTFKRFTLGDGMKVYTEEKPARTKITVSHYSRLMQTGVGACRGLSITNS